MTCLLLCQGFERSEIDSESNNSIIFQKCKPIFVEMNKNSNKSNKALKEKSIPQYFERLKCNLSQLNQDDHQSKKKTPNNFYEEKLRKQYLDLKKNCGSEVIIECESESIENIDVAEEIQIPEEAIETFDNGKDISVVLDDDSFDSDDVNCAEINCVNEVKKLFLY